MRLSAQAPVVFFIIFLTLFLLIGNRLDWKIAGGAGAGAHADAILVRTTGPASSLSLQRGEVIATDARTFSSYQVQNRCTVDLAENSSLLFQDGRINSHVFGFLTGRIVAHGDCTFVIREMEISTSGTATLVHYSWLDKVIVKALEGSTVVSQGTDVTTALTPEGPAYRFSTLPPDLTHEETVFSFEQDNLVSSFYTWSLSQ
ncbi:hypothetical protein EBT25_12920 [bacterium]|nr:hypothetical protein [bacterium]